MDGFDPRWLALLVAGAAFVVLVAVAASGIGPASSLRRSVGRLAELNEEVGRLQRTLDRLERSSRRLRDET